MRTERRKILADFGVISVKRFAASPAVGPRVRKGLGKAALPLWTLPTLQPGARASRTLGNPGAKVRGHVVLVPRTGLGKAALGL